MLDLPTIGIIAIVLLSLFLYYRIVAAPQRTRQHQPAGKPIDTSSIASKVAAVRHDPLGALEAKAVRKSRRSILIATARGMIRQLSFFRSREHEHSA